MNVWLKLSLACQDWLWVHMHTAQVFQQVTAPLTRPPHLEGQECWVLCHATQQPNHYPAAKYPAAHHWSGHSQQRSPWRQHSG
jgi:hypothetical protein